MRHRSGWIVCLCLCACLLLAGTAGAADTSGGAVSRGAFVDALYDAHVAHGGTPVVSEGSAAPFRDVGSWSPYFEALCWAKASGIANGYSGGTFRPDAPVTRQQAAVMLYRYAQVTELETEEISGRELASYQDAAAVPAWSREAVTWAVDSGLWFSGSAAQLRPTGTVTQEELAAMTEALFQGGLPAAEGPLDTGTEGLALELRQCSTTGATVLLKNGTEETFSYDADYGLYRQINGGWYQLNHDMVVIQVLYTLEPGASQELTFHWGDLEEVGVLAPGTYRISQSGTLGETPAAVAESFIIQ